MQTLSDQALNHGTQLDLPEGHCRFRKYEVAGSPAFQDAENSSSLSKFPGMDSRGSKAVTASPVIQLRLTGHGVVHGGRRQTATPIAVVAAIILIGSLHMPLETSTTNHHLFSLDLGPLAALWQYAAHTPSHLLWRIFEITNANFHTSIVCPNHRWDAPSVMLVATTRSVYLPVDAVIRYELCIIPSRICLLSHTIRHSLQCHSATIETMLSR